MKKGGIQQSCYMERFSCPYMHDGRIAAVEYMLPSEDDVRTFHEYLSRGYRRIDSLFYRNCCEGCSSCIPIRLAVADFTASRSQKRTLRENEDIEVRVLSVPSVTGEKVRLYETYLRTKHQTDEETADHDPERSLRMIHCGFEHALEMDYYLGDRLIGVGIVDTAKDALSSNYYYYDTAHLSRRLGIYSVMQEIMLALCMKKRYYYLGFYIAETEKMAYKKFFRPNQILSNGRWVSFMNGPSGGRGIRRKSAGCA
ncbi:MAG: arginyltransferase [Nitrospirae bacterium]|nr:arginyltransferase [Nitrospirota bacterium]